MTESTDGDNDHDAQTTFRTPLAITSSSGRQMMTTAGHA